MKIFFFAAIVFFGMTTITMAQPLDLNSLPLPKSVTVGRTIGKAGSIKLIQTARLFYAFWNTGKEEYARASVSQNFKDNTLPKGRPQGFNGLLFASKNFRTAVPDLTCTIEDLIITEDKITARLNFKGRNTGPLNGDQPSGNTVSFFAIDILHVNNGKIFEDWHLEDNLTFLQQIGIVK